MQRSPKQNLAMTKADQIVLSGGLLVDGTGAPPTAGDLLIGGDLIMEIGHFAKPSQVPTIDCSGLIVAPGFIDGHSHSDLQVLENRPEKIAQGVTTEVVGNCGFSAYPAPPNKGALVSFANGILGGSETWGWDSAKEYLTATRSAPFVNVFSLVGHGSLRIWAAGSRQGILSEREMDAVVHRLAEELQSGACGFSTGLMYAPGSAAPAAELESLCTVVARHNKTYATHMRDYSEHLVEAVDEQLALARQTGCRLQISHFQAVGSRNWPLQQVALEKIERAREEGIDVFFDCYPYTCGSTVLTQLLPQWVLDGGIDEMLARLADSEIRSKVAAQAEAVLAQGWHNIFIASVSSSENNALVGKSIAEIGAIRSESPVETAIALLIEERGRVNILELNQSEANLRQTVSHPLSNIISDGFYLQGKPHPRLYGTFPLLLGEICRNRSWLTLPEAIHKITDLPARRFRIAKRGKLAPGYFADITVFDASSISSPATYANPKLAPVGIRHVFRGGRRVFGDAGVWV